MSFAVIETKTAIVVERPWLLAAVSVGAFVTSLDAGAVVAVLPLVRKAFAAEISTVQWVLTAELILTSGLLLIFGRLGDQIGRRRVYLIGFTIFLSGIIMCGTAKSLVWLIAYRSFQGIGTAMLLSNSSALLASHAPSTRLGSWFGTKLSCIYLGLVAGPILGNWLAGVFGWRAVFWMELPAALASLILAARCIPHDRPTTPSSQIGFKRASVWVVTLASLVWLLSRYKPTISSLWALLAVPLLLFAYVVALERHNPEAILDLSGFKRSTFCVALISLLIAFSASYMLTFVLPFYLIEGRHQSSIGAGELIATYSLARSLMAWISGWFSDRVSLRVLAGSGSLLLACSLAVLAMSNQHSPRSVVIGSLVLAGLGFGCFVPPNNKLVMASAPSARYGLAAGMLATARSIGMVVGIALAAALMSNKASLLLASPNLTFAIAALLALLAATLTASPPRGEQCVDERSSVQVSFRSS